jgi:hypothetical protein
MKQTRKQNGKKKKKKNFFTSTFLTFLVLEADLFARTIVSEKTNVRKTVKTKMLTTVSYIMFTQQLTHIMDV